MSLAEEDGVEAVVTPAARLCMPCSRPGIKAGPPAAACCSARKLLSYNKYGIVLSKVSIAQALTE